MSRAMETGYCAATKLERTFVIGIGAQESSLGNVKRKNHSETGSFAI